MQSSLDASDEVRLCALIDFIACQVSPLDAGVSLQEGLERACEEMSSESSVEVVSKVVGSKPVVPQHGKWPAAKDGYCEVLRHVGAVCTPPCFKVVVSSVSRGTAVEACSGVLI